MSSSNCCFLTCIQIPQEARQVVWYSHLLKNFPQFIVIKGFGIVNKAEIGVFLELSCVCVFLFVCLFMILQMSTIWSVVPLPFLKPAWTSGSSWFTYCWRLTWIILSITLLACAPVAAAKSLQSCLTLRDPMDCSLPGSPIHGIFQARVVEWSSITFSD